MALIPYPPGTFTTFNESHLNYSRQIAIEADWSQTRTFLNRSYPEWVGTTRIEDAQDETTARNIEAWLSAFEGRANTTLLPLHRPTIETTITVSGRSIRADGSLIHSTSSSLTGVLPGSRVKSGNRVYEIRQVLSGAVVLDPQRPIAAGQDITAATDIEVRLVSTEHPEQPRDPHFWGPWIINWVEA